MSATGTPQPWQIAYRAWSTPTTPVVEPEPGVIVDLDRPTFEIVLDGAVFASSQVPAKAKAMFDTMTSPAAKLRYGYRSVEFRVVNDRRSAPRG